MPNDTPQGQPFSCGIADSAIAEAGRVPLDALHFDVDAILHAFDAIKPVADRPGIPPPTPANITSCRCCESKHNAPASAVISSCLPLLKGASLVAN